MLKWVDRLLNQVTMYRLIVYYLSALLGTAVILSALGVLPYDPVAVLFTTGFLLAVCWLTNTVFAWAYKVPANVESPYISALILALILTPITSPNDLWFIGWAGVVAMASKYIIAINRKHIFNPVIFAVALLAIAVNKTASWWVGTAALLPVVLLGGALIVRKVGRAGMVLSFLATACGVALLWSLLSGDNAFTTLRDTLLSSPLFFFAFVILTEPLSTPPTQTLQISYAILVGFLFAPQVHLGSLYTTPEGAMLLGNIFSWVVSPKSRFVLRLKERIQIAPDIYDFIFMSPHRLAFAPGQYMEWTLAHGDPDSRGNRRYFTLASSPTEGDLRIGVKFYDGSSTFKQSLLKMGRRMEIMAGQLGGDFTLPDDPRQPCVFIAGGIGITPFRSMIQFLLDKRQPRPITLFYTNKTVHEIVYRNVFDRARQELGVKTIYTITSVRDTPPSGAVKVGRVDAKLIRSEAPDYKQCLFYVSGPNAMVASTKKMLLRMGVARKHIKTDYFPGLM